MLPAAEVPVLTAPRRFLGRQPIIDAHRRIFGDRILLSPAPSLPAPSLPNPSAPSPAATDADPSADQAAREMLDHWLLLLPDSESRPAFLPCTRALLLQEFVTLLPPAGAVLGLPPALEPDAELVACCRALRRHGFRFSLDGFRPGDPRLPLLDLASFVHFDFARTPHSARRQIYDAAPRGVQFLAANLEAEMQMRMALG